MFASHVVRPGGHFVCKLFDLFTPFSVGLVYLMYRSVTFQKANAAFSKVVSITIRDFFSKVVSARERGVFQRGPKLGVVRKVKIAMGGSKKTIESVLENHYFRVQISLNHA